MDYAFTLIKHDDGDERTILIIGATKGIGYATSVRLSHQGHNV
jgi:NAD(P)-dependent dehydrogenase (short-subunit alcohol dehydrogenase family)